VLALEIEARMFVEMGRGHRPEVTGVAQSVDEEKVVLHTALGRRQQTVLAGEKWARPYVADEACQSAASAVPSAVPSAAPLVAS